MTLRSFSPLLIPAREKGDRLNLKSKLSQYISLAHVFSVKEDIPEMELVAYEPEDVQKLIDFMINQ